MHSVLKGSTINQRVTIKPLALFIILGFFMHVGTSYYGSICTILFLAVLIYVYPRISSSLSLTRIVLSLTVFGAAFSIPLLIFGSTETLDLLRYGRDVFFGVVSISILTYSASRNKIEISKSHLARTHKLITASIVFAFFIVAVQYFAIRSGSLFNPIPIDFFGRNYETLSRSNTFGYRTRPTGTFGEPSYFALYLMFLVLSKNELQKLSPSRDFHFVLFISGISFLLLESGLGIVALVVILLISASERRIIIALTVSISAFFLFAQYPESIFLRKAFSTLSWDERIGTSFAKLFDYWRTYPFGFPPRQLFGAESIVLGDERTGVFLNNGLAYFLYAYGILGLGIVLWLAFVLAKLQVSIKVFCLFLLYQNGSFLDFDKISLLILFTLITKMGIISEIPTKIPMAASKLKNVKSS